MLDYYNNIVILTGAGLSAESGLSTFRDKDGIWMKHDLAEVATPEGFARNPDKVQDFYNVRRKQVVEAKPNAAHKALARLEKKHPGEVLTVTQNIDALHEAAGTTKLIHMHGQLNQALCSHCEARHSWLDDITTATPCPECGWKTSMRRSHAAISSSRSAPAVRSIRPQASLSKRNGRGRAPWSSILSPRKVHRYLPNRSTAQRRKWFRNSWIGYSRPEGAAKL